MSNNHLDTIFDLKTELDASTSKLEAIEKAKPEIKLKEPGAIYVESISQHLKNQDGIIVFSRTVPFLKVRFVNDPHKPSPTAKAIGVRAKINYYRCSDNAHIFEMDGRWAETDQPPAIHPLASKSHLLSVDFTIGEERSLDIAYLESDGQCLLMEQRQLQV